MNEELKPCPFCGGKAKYLDSSNEYEDYHEVCCKDKTCTYSLTERGTKEAAYAAWNTRTAPQNEKD